MNRVCLKHQLSNESIKEGKVSGIAYSGALIPNFGLYQNFIVDVSSLSIPKKKTALLKDHVPSLAIGHASATKEENRVIVEGLISKKVKEGADVVSLAEDDFEWEMSIGVYDGFLEPDFTGEVNGIKVEKANVLRNGVLREVSVVSLGADMNTSMNILKMNPSKIQENEMEKEIKKLKKVFNLAETAEVEEVVEKAEEIVEKAEEAIANVSERDQLIKELQDQIEELQKKLEAIQAETEANEREEQAEMAAKEKGITLSNDKIKEVAKSKESFDLFMSVIADVKIENKIDAKLCGKQNFSGGKPVDGKLSSDEMRDMANKMVKNGEASNFLEALNKISQEKK